MAGENILDSWGLLHACYGHHQALDIGATYIGLNDGYSLNDLTPAPSFADLWKTPSSAILLLDLIIEAQSRFVRVWAMQLLHEIHPNHDVDVQTLWRLLDHENAEIQQFGASLLEKSTKLATLTLDTWFQLLKTRNLEALQVVCNAFEARVAPERLSGLQCMELACVAPVPIARLGLRLTQQRLKDCLEDRAVLIEAAKAKCQAMGKELAEWALSILGNIQNYDCNAVIQFFDSLNAEVRSAAWNWLVADSPGLSDPLLWSRICETPYDDLRLRMVDFIHAHWGEIDATKCPESAWRSVIFGVHHGGRQKIKATYQVSQAIINDPSRIDNLLPILAVAVRSVRPPECRAGLAAVLRIAEAHPELNPRIHELLPELKWEVSS
jgi:hypothetical protein